MDADTLATIITILVAVLGSSAITIGTVLKQTNHLDTKFSGKFDALDTKFTEKIDEVLVVTHPPGANSLARQAREPDGKVEA